MSYLGSEIKKLGFGLMRLPKVSGDSANDVIDVEQVKKMVDLFMEAGFTYFDTAWAYTGSEEAIRKALVERYPRESYQLATKIPAWRRSNAADARADFDISLEQTGAGYFDFYLIHNTGDSRTATFDKFGMWEWMDEIKAQGKVKHIGFSHHDNADVLEELLQAHPNMEFVQLQVNYADWENPSTQSRKCVEVAAKYGKPVIIMEPVRGGTLANPPQAVADILREADPERSAVDWALSFAMDTPGIITVLSGMSSLGQMEQNLQTWKNFKPLADDERATLKRAQEKLDELLDNPCTGCHYCMKECPMNIDIANMMQALNRAAIYDDAHGKHWFNFATARPGVGKPSECIQCGQCEAACPQHLPIVSLLESCRGLE